MRFLNEYVLEEQVEEMMGPQVSRITLAALMFWACFVAHAGGAVEVSIDKMKFEPQHLTIKPGTTVTWVNREKRNNHSIHFEQEGLPESERFFPGESWSRTFDKPGVYPYVCGPHPEMTGVVEVAE